MRRVLFVSCFIIAGGAAHAAIPTINATCPMDIELHVDAGGLAFINGEEAATEVYSDTAFDAVLGDTTVSVLLNPDGTATVSYTAAGGANGMCEATVSE